MKYSYFIFLMTLISCSCDDDHSGSPYLEKDYNYVVGILVPDSFRNYRQEIFVGQMLDIEVPVEKLDTNHYGEDTALYVQNIVTWHDYRGKIVGSNSATVSIKDMTDSQTVSFVSIGNGIYRDINNNLKVKPMHSYQLDVNDDGKIYTAITTVPSNFNILNINENDTAIVSVSLPRPDYHSFWGELLIYWSSSINSFYYKTSRWSSLFSPIPKYVYEPPSFIMMVIDTNNYIDNYTINASICVDAYDTNYGRMYSPDESCTAPTDLLTYLSDQETRPLPERTSIKGNNVVGVFGSLNRIKNSFYMRAVKQ